jgi:hypothetical protein
MLLDTLLSTFILLSFSFCFRFSKDYPLSGGPAQELAWYTVSMFILFDPGACPAGAFATRLLGLEKWHECGIALMEFECFEI